MISLVECPQGRGGDWNFRLFGIPVRVTFWFWLVSVVMFHDPRPKTIVMWVAVCFVSILVHEFGHVWAFRRFGVNAEPVLYAWGGLAIPDRDLRGTLPNFVVSLAGPAAGFCLAALTLAV